MKSLLASFLSVFALLASGCTGQSEDETLYMTGTEELAVKTADGEYVCESPKKVLICHIPPGNPDNAHTICVSTHAVETHVSHHGDLVGVCDGDVPEDPPAPEADAGAEEPEPPHEDAGPIIVN